MNVLMIISWGGHFLRSIATLYKKYGKDRDYLKKKMENVNNVREVNGIFRHAYCNVSTREVSCSHYGHFVDT